MELNVHDFNYYLLKHGSFKSENIKQKEISYTINENGIFDEGLLLAIIDSFSSMATKAYYEEGVTINLNIKSLSEMILGKNYNLLTKVLKVSEKYVLLQCSIFDEKNNLVKLATHTKALVRPKYYVKF
jgi:hypothetical protein